MRGNKNCLGYRHSEASKLKMSMVKKARNAQRRLLQSALLLLAVLLFTCGATRAQTPLQDDPVAKALEQAVNRLAVAEEKNRLLQDRLQAKDATIQGLEGVVKVRDQQLELALSANKDRAQVNNGDARMLAQCENQLSKADARIFSLEHPGFWKSLFDQRTLTGAAIGFGAARVIK